MAPRKKPANTKAAKAEKASTDDQTNSGDVTQAGEGKVSAETASTPASDTPKDAEPASAAKDPAARTAQDVDAGSATSAASEPASDPHSPEQSDVRAAERIAALEGQAEVMVETVSNLIGRVEALSNRLETALEKPGQAVIWDNLGETRDLPIDTTVQLGPDNLEVTVTGPVKGFWRCGHRFGPEPVVIPANQLTTDQIKALEAEPTLVVKVDVKKAAPAD